MFPIPITFFKASAGGFAYDGLAVAPIRLRSLRRALSSYTGPLIRLRRVSDNAESDFGYLADGSLDQAAIDTWRSGSAVECVTLYDQVPFGAVDATQPVASRQPSLISGALDFDGSDSLDWAEAITLPRSVYMAMRSDSKAGNNVHWSATGGAGYSIGFTEVTTGYPSLDQTGGLGLRHCESQVDWVDGLVHVAEMINFSQNGCATRFDGLVPGVQSGSTGNLVSSTTMKYGAYLTALHLTGIVYEMIEFAADFLLVGNLADRNLVGNAMTHWGASYTDVP